MREEVTQDKYNDDGNKTLINYDAGQFNTSVHDIEKCPLQPYVAYAPHAATPQNASQCHVEITRLAQMVTVASGTNRK